MEVAKFGQNKGLTTGDNPSDSQPRKLEREGSIPEGANRRNVLLEREAEKANQRAEDFANASKAERDLELHGEQVNGKVIIEALEKDQFVRDGNITFPAPEPRPVGSSPSQVDGAFRFFGDQHEAMRVESFESTGEPNFEKKESVTK